MNLFGRRQDEQPGTSQAGSQMTDEQALARYRYMLQTAPPEDIERAHEEAFAQLTPEQRRQALQALSRVVPPSEIRGDDPASLARTATRAEVRQPGTIERVWGVGAPGIGSWFLATLAASFIGTAVAESFFDDQNALQEAAQGAARDDDTAGEANGESAGGDNADDGGEGYGGDEYGGDIGDAGDFGGGDFGGGDFGGI